MVFLAQKIRRKFEGSPTFVILTDRDELNKQISDTFENCGLLGSKASQFIASSGEDLMAKLRGNPSFIFTLIQKFNHSDVQPIFRYRQVLCANSFTSLAEQSLHKAGNLPLIIQ